MKLRKIIIIQLIGDIICLISFILIAVMYSDWGYFSAACWVVIAMMEHWRNFKRYYDQ
jgi:hypothetical protein